MQRIGHAAQVVGGQHRVGRVHRCVRSSRSHGETHVGTRQHRSVVHPVAHVSRAPAAVDERFERREFVGREEFGVPLVESEFARQGFHLRPLVAREHHRVHARSAQLFHGREGRSARAVVTHRECPRRTAVDAVGHRDHAVRERAGFVENHRVDVRRAIQMQAAFEEDAAARSHPDAAEIAQRHAQHQGAGAGSHQKDQGAIPPLRRRDAPVGTHGRQERGHGGEQGSQRHHNGGVDAGDARHHLFGRGFAFGGLLHEVHDARKGILAVGFRHADAGCAVEGDDAGRQLVAGREGARSTLAGEGRSVGAEDGGEQYAVEGQARTALNVQHRAASHRFGVDLAERVGRFVHHRAVVGTQSGH